MPFLYILIIHASRKAKIKVGALGEVEFEKGWYAYTGSANSGIWRIRRHFKKGKALRWHIDYLTEKFPPERAYAGHFNFTECSLARKMGNLVKKGFGSSDTKCFSHLSYFKSRKNLDEKISNIKFETLISSEA